MLRTIVVVMVMLLFSLWHEWIIENDTFAGMHYTLGETCGTSDREAAVSIPYRTTICTFIYVPAFSYHSAFGVHVEYI